MGRDRAPVGGNRLNQRNGHGVGGLRNYQGDPARAARDPSPSFKVSSRLDLRLLVGRLSVVLCSQVVVRHVFDNNHIGNTISFLKVE